MEGKVAHFLTELVLPLTHIILKLAIGFIMRKKRLANFKNINCVNKFCEKKRNWKSLTLASLIFRKAQLDLLMKVCAPISKCYGTNVRRSGKKINIHVLYLKREYSIQDYGKWELRQEITRFSSNHDKLGLVPILMFKTSKLVFFC